MEEAYRSWKGRRWVIIVVNAGVRGGRVMSELRGAR